MYSISLIFCTIFFGAIANRNKWLKEADTGRENTGIIHGEH
jgi:hypothetical protein